MYDRVVKMEYYGRNDMTLGLFLERYCFRDFYKCSSEPCDTGMVDHIRRFAHGNACLQVSGAESFWLEHHSFLGSYQVMLKKLDVAMPGGNQNILMWGWCKKCKQVSVPFLLEFMCIHSALSFSFSRWLQLFQCHLILGTCRSPSSLSCAFMVMCMDDEQASIRASTPCTMITTSTMDASRLWLPLGNFVRMDKAPSGEL
jgi:hypothetical protein